MGDFFPFFLFFSFLNIYIFFFICFKKGVGRGACVESVYKAKKDKEFTKSMKIKKMRVIT